MTLSNFPPGVTGLEPEITGLKRRSDELDAEKWAAQDSPPENDCCGQVGFHDTEACPDVVTADCGHRVHTDDLVVYGHPESDGEWVNDADSCQPCADAAEDAARAAFDADNDTPEAFAEIARAVREEHDLVAGGSA